MKDEQPGQHALADSGAAAQERGQVFTHERNRSENIARHGRPPIGKLLPNQGVACESHAEGGQENQAPDHPVAFARSAIGARKEHPRHVQQHGDDHQVRRPAMHAPNEPAETDVRRNRLHALVRVIGAGYVVEGEKDSAKDLDDEQVGRRPANAPPPAVQVAGNRLAAGLNENLLLNREPLLEPFRDSGQGRAHT